MEGIADFFTNIVDFFIHIFVPTDEQWEEIKQSYVDLMDLLKSKLPFINEFKASLENAQTQVFASNDFLKIKMPSFSFFGGQTEEVQYLNVHEAYEPYRQDIREWLSYIVYGCGFVYLLKTVLNYNATAQGVETVANIKSKGD